MPKLFELSVYTCFFYFLVWVIWLFLVVPVEVDSAGLGSLAFLPHAARVLPVLFFGIYPEPLLNTIETSITNLIDTYKYSINVTK